MLKGTGATRSALCIERMRLLETEIYRENKTCNILFEMFHGKRSIDRLVAYMTG